MKPHEIIDEYSDTDEDIIEHLKKKGYKYLGAGVDQTAFLEPGGETVLKIFGTQNEVAKAPKTKADRPIFSQDHQMFFLWARYCNEHSSNPFLPKFSGFESFYWNKHVYLQIRQERLRDIDRMTGLMLSDMADLAEDGLSFNEMINEISESSCNKQLNALKKKVGMKGIQLLYKTLIKLSNIANQHGWTLDLHNENFMARADGTPVIVDPWVL